MFVEIRQLLLTSHDALFWHDLSAASVSKACDLPGEVGGEMSCLSCLAKRSRVKGGEGRGGAGGRVLIVAETLPTKKTHRLFKRNHRYPCQSCILPHTQNQWDQISSAVRWYCFPLCYHHQEPLVLHVLPPWHHIQFGDQGMLSWECWDVGTGSAQAEYEETVYVSNTNPLQQILLPYTTSLCFSWH